MADTALLEVSGLTKRYGGLTAVDHVDLRVEPGQSLGVIGPNGAGKSTLVGLVSGATPASDGRVVLDGTDVTARGAADRTRLGIGRTHQIPRPFRGMTVLENVQLAARHARTGREPVKVMTQRCHDVLERTGLTTVAGDLGGTLPLLTRKRLELARALALQPRLLLLDEIGAGLVEHEIAELIELIQQLRGEVEGILLIEHVMDVITSCCDSTAVLNFGQLLTQGSTSQVLADPEVAAVYLGTAAGSGTPAPSRPRDVPPSREVLLEVRGVEVTYGGVRALRGVDLELRAGEVVTLLGANGAGKTTLANAISGVVPLAAGSIRLGERDLAGLRPDQVTAAGVAHCMEGRRIFASLSVEENLVLAAGRIPRAEVAQRLARVYDLFPVLAERRSGSGTAMSGGQQQMLAIGRALMTDPRVVLFDEISLGLAPVAVDTLYDALATLRASGLAMVVVEQDLERGLGLADRAYVLNHGRVALAGTPDEIRSHPSLTSLYVGEPVGDEGHRTTERHPS